jgi:glyoxylase-like metal-dependent hydrolase (beta-lactamase superfamily II)
MSASRREFIAGSALALIGGAVGGREVVRAWQQRQGAPPASPVFTPIRRNVGYFTMRGGTIGYLVDPGGVAVVDTQFMDSAQVFLAGLQERSKNRGVDRLLNTHHHGDHVSGNMAFKGVAKRVVAHATAAEHMKSPPGRQGSTAEQLYPDATFTDVWREQIGGEWIRAKHYGRAHTGGDAVITFERANVAHMGDLMFNRRHPVVDRPAGASLRNWAMVLEKAAGDHDNGTTYIFGHAGGQHPVVGPRAELLLFRDYLTGLLEFVQGQIKAGRSQAEITAIREPLPKFPDHGPLNASILGNAYGELTEGG